MRLFNMSDNAPLSTNAYSPADLERLAKDAAADLVASRLALRYDEDTLRWSVVVGDKLTALAVTFRIHTVGHYQYETLSLTL